MSAAEEDRWQRLIRGLRDGDADILHEFCDRYGPQLERVADKHLAMALRRRVGPEDVAQSACRTFLRRARGGEFQFTGSDDLWRLLSAITLTKVREHSRFHLRQKRGLHRETPLDGNSGGPALYLRDPSPTPAEDAEFADFFQQVMAELDEEEKGIVHLKLQGFTTVEAAEQLGLSERTTRRLLKGAQTRLRQALKET